MGGVAPWYPLSDKEGTKAVNGEGNVQKVHLCTKRVHFSILKVHIGT